MFTKRGKKESLDQFFRGLVVKSRGRRAPSHMGKKTQGRERGRNGRAEDVLGFLNVKEVGRIGEGKKKGGSA